MAELVDVEPGSAEWLAIRREGITATDIPVILGLTTWDSRFSLWHRKAGNLPERPDSDLFKWARHGEQYVMGRWAEAHDEPRIESGGLWRDGWRMATPDYLTASGVIECKTVATWEGWGPSLSDEIPERVRVQVQWQLAVLDRSCGYVAAVNRTTGQFRHYIVLPATEEEAGRQFFAGLEFWQSLERGEAPPVDDAVATTDALKALHPRDDTGSAEVSSDAWYQYQGAVKELQFHELLKRGALNKIREDMGSARYALVDGERVLSRITGKVEGHWVAPHEQDYLRAVKRKDKGDAAS